MKIAAGQTVYIKGSPIVWQVLSAGPKRVRVRPVDPSSIRTAVTVPADSVIPYTPTTTATIEAARRRSHAKAAWGNGL